VTRISGHGTALGGEGLEAVALPVLEAVEFSLGLYVAEHGRRRGVVVVAKACNIDQNSNSCNLWTAQRTFFCVKED
jgi:hypothetical protein